MLGTKNHVFVPLELLVKISTFSPSIYKLMLAVPDVARYWRNHQSAIRDLFTKKSETRNKDVTIVYYSLGRVLHREFDKPAYIYKSSQVEKLVWYHLGKSWKERVDGIEYENYKQLQKFVDEDIPQTYDLHHITSVIVDERTEKKFAKAQNHHKLLDYSSSDSSDSEDEICQQYKWDKIV